jgi:hypothetical protein
MRWAARVLGMPHAAWRLFVGFVRARTGCGPEEQEAPAVPVMPMREPSDPLDHWEFDLYSHDRQPTPARVAADQKTAPPLEPSDTRPTLPNADRPPSSHPPGRRTPRS